MTLVLDASAAVELLLRTPRGAQVEAHLADQLVAIPDLLDVEVCSALARLERKGEVTGAEGDEAVRRLGRLPARRIGAGLLRDRAWAMRDRVRVADAFYVAAASVVSGALLTCDARLARASLTNVSITLVR